MYRVCLLAAGKGTRNKYAEGTNKALLMVGDKPAFAHIIDKFPEDTEIVVALRHNAVMVWEIMLRYYNGLDRARREFDFTNVIEDRGPGYSLLWCKPFLQCPFIFTSCDTIVEDAVPPPDRNWIGVGNVDNPGDYLTVETKNWRVRRFYDHKEDSPSHLAFNGMAGVYDYKEFWEGLANPTLVNGEHQVTDGLKALLNKKLGVRLFSWTDIGSTKGYEDANGRFSKNISI